MRYLSRFHLQTSSPLIASLVFATLLLGAESAYGTCSSPANPIEAENCLPGNPASEWQISGSGDTTIQGYATDISVNVGQTINFKVETDATNYVVEIYRIGYYGGLGARRITVLNPSVPLPQSQPACLTDNSTLLYDCGNWAISATWQVPANATSGLYFAHLLRNDTGGDSHVFFVVRNDASTSDILYQTSDLTWQAYNDYGGHSLYGDQSEFNISVRAFKASYNRPSDTRNFEAATFLFNAEYPMIRFLEANGYNLSYFTGVDAARNSSLILHHKIYMSSGHDEYWDGTQRANIKAARDGGVNLAFFSGNEMFWKTRWENSIDGTNTPYRTLVCYKETYADAGDPLDPPIWTGTWRDPTKSPPADGGRPENAISGTMFMVNGPGPDNTNLSIQVPQADGQMRFWRNTSIASLPANQTATLPSGTLGYEWDVDPRNSVRPAGLFYLSTATYDLTTDYLLDYGVTYGAGTATHHLTMYRAPSGALVFGAGTVQWAWGLDNNHDGSITPPPDQDMQQATVNLFADMGAQPATLQPGLQPASQSTDTIDPVSTITSPSTGTSVNAGAPVVITGTANDVGGGVVAGIEVSTDGGQTWHPAVGRSNWTYTWVPNVIGTVSLMSRAVDDSGNLENPQTSGGNPPTGIPVNVNPQLCPCTIWNPSIGPHEVDSGDANGIEVGVKFRTDNDGVITGLRFYKASTNTGTHVGHLWTSSGTLLGTVTFTGESGSGWQQVQFATPVAVTANTVYVASYFAPNGHYSADVGYFTGAGYDDPPLYALANGVSGPNGVYSYTATPGVFPTSTFVSTNYWVDILFVSGTTFDIGGNVAGIGGINATVTLSGAGNASTTTDSAGNYQFSGLANGFYTITPSNSGVTFSPASQNVTLNGLSLYNVNFGSVATSPLTIAGTINGGGAGTVVNLSGLTSLSTSADSSGHYSFNGLIAGTYVITPAQAGYLFTPTSQVITLGSFSDTAVNFAAQPCPCISIWQPTAIPSVPDGGDSGAVEVGVKFRSDAAGTIQGLRFYKATRNTGTHIGHIWSSTGLLLGTATFANDTASGWQEVNFNPPITIASNAVYVASYFAPLGHYSFDTNYFQNAGVDNAPLHALANGVSGPNGVFAYGSAPSFPNNGTNAANYWVDVVFAPSPTHTVSGNIAGPGGPGSTVLLSGGNTISTTADASGNFTFPNTGDGTYVLTVSHAGFAFTAPSQTVTVSGTNVNGVMFATLPNCIPCDSIWSITATPTVADAGDPLSANVGTKFRSDSDGEIAGLRFYKSALNTGNHVGTLWSSNGTLLGSVTFENESQFGWQQALFPNPIPIEANTTYVVAYLAPSGHYAADANFFATTGTDNPPLHALASGVDGQNGVFAYGNTIAFPNSSYQADNYWVDAIFTPTGPTHAISGTISGSGGPGATVTLGGASNVSVTADASGNFSFSGLAVGAYMVTPSHAGYAFSPGVQPLTISGADVNQVNFGTVQNCPCSTIWPQSAIPTVVDVGDNSSVNVGVKFRANNDGYIVGVRFYKSPLNTGIHVGALWSDTGTQLATATFTGESVSGWQQVLFDTAVPVTANTTYIASYLAPAGHYAGDANFFTNTGVDNPPLHALMNGMDGPNGVFAYSATTAFPNQSFQAANYWVDVIYVGIQSYGIAGTIGGPGGPGATVVLSGSSTTSIQADAGGNYTFGGLQNGTYTVSPASNVYTYNPISQSVTVNNGHVLNVNFTSGYGIAGVISGPGGPGAAVTLTGTSSATTLADGSGNYIFTGLPNGNYTITVSKTGYLFAPASLPATLNGASAYGLNFSSAAQTYTLSGNIGGPGGPGATVSLSGNSTTTVTADGLGNYSFPGVTNGTYVITPSRPGYVFTPASQSITVAGGNVTANFSSVLQTNSITGTLSVPGGPNATVSLTGPANSTTTADTSGNYSFTGLPNGNYVVTPNHAGFAFAPTSQSVTIAGTNATANFSSTPQTYSITGTISGGGGPGATVTLTGSSVATTTADISGNYSFTGLLNGSYIVTVGNARYVFTPASADVVINGSNYTGLNFNTVSGCPACDTVWGPSNVPSVPDSGDPTSMELGAKIRADTDGYIRGLRFYKAPNNTGIHIAHLWSSAGTLLGTVTITGESATGWQQMFFASPIPVVANTTYVASYLAPAGHYSGDISFFASSGADNAPLHALANGVDGPNGVFLATATGGFPTSTNQATNYWVDVVYSNTMGYSILGTITGPGAVGSTVSLTGAVTASTTADASGNFSFNSLANGSYTVTPSNGSSVFTPASQSATINGAHVMNVNFTVAAAALASVSLSPSSVLGGNSSTGMVTLNGPAPAGGALVTLSSSNTSAAQVPASVTVAANATTATFAVTTSPVAADTPLTISGTYSATQSGSLTVTAAVLSSVTLNPTSVPRGASSTGTVTLNGPAAAGGAVVTLSSSNTSAAQVPATVTVAANATTATFTVTTSTVGSNTSVTITGTRGATQTAALTITSTILRSITLSPASVVGGTSSTATVTLTTPAPTGGATIVLSSSNTAAAQVPASVTVAANATTATFTVTTNPVASNTPVTVTGVYGATNTATLNVNAAVLNSVSVSPITVIGGTSSTGTVRLNGPAPASGAVVALSSSNTAAAQVPASITIAANATSATFTVTTTPVASNTQVTISGVYGATKVAALNVNAATLSSVSLSPASVLGGSSSTGTVKLNGPAPAAGATVSLSSNTISVAQQPASVTIAPNATTATFTITTVPVASDTSVTITGIYGNTRTATLTVRAAALNSVSLSPNSVIGGTASTATVVLTGPAPAAGAVVTLSSSDTAAAQVPASVTVAPNATTATFTIATSPVASNTSVTITVTHISTRTATLTVRAATLSSVSLSPSAVIGGTSSTGTVTLTGPAPASGTVVTLSSSAAVAQVPTSVTVPANASTATFTITTSPVASNTSVNITGTLGVSRSASLSVTAPTVSSLALSPTSVVGGTPSTGTVTLAGPAPATGTVATLSSSSTSVASTPSSVTVAAGNSVATFTITTHTVTNSTSVTISATRGTTQTAILTVTP